MLDLFEEYEKCEDAKKEVLEAFYTLFHGFFMLNKVQILEQLLAPDVILRAVGPLEYDPVVPRRPRHREFLLDASHFRQVIDLPPELLCDIHQVYRIQYVKEVALGRTLEDSTFASMNNMLYLSQVRVLSKIQHNAPFLKELFTQLTDSSTPPARYRALSELLQELCCIARCVRPSDKVDMFW
jgi:protein phosphatase 4 regulatory subunit 3